MQTCTFGIVLLLAAEPAPTWTPVIPDQPTIAAPAPELPMQLPSIAPQTVAANPESPLVSATLPSTTPVVVMEAIPTVPIQNTAFGQSNESAAPKKGWFPRLFRNGIWKKRQEPEALPPPDPIPERAASPLLSRNGDRTPSDHILISRCRAHIYNDQQLSGTAIHVVGQNGVLYLRGTVSSAAIKERAELIARKTEGAQQVVNELAVRQVAQPWFQSSPVQLATPTTEQGSPIASRRLPPAAPQAPTLSAMPAAATQDFAIPPAPVSFDLSPATASAPVEPAQAASFHAPSPWLPGMPAQPAAPAVQLGRPEVLSSRPGLPTVTTYLIRRTEESGWPAAPAAPIGIEPKPSETEESFPIRPTARFVIPAPAAAPDAQTAYLAPRSIGPRLAARPTSIAAPAMLGSSSGLRADIDEAIRQNPATERLHYRVSGGELILSGEVASAAHLYELTGRLNDLPGIEVVSFENLNILH